MARYSVLTTTFTAAASVSEPIRIDGFDRIIINAQTWSVFATTAAVVLRVQGSNTTTTSTFKDIHAMGVYSAGSGILAWETPSGVGNAMYECTPIVGCQYMRLKFPANTATAAGGVEVLCYQRT